MGCKNRSFLQRFVLFYILCAFNDFAVQVHYPSYNSRYNQTSDPSERACDSPPTSKLSFQKRHVFDTGQAGSDEEIEDEEGEDGDDDKKRIDSDTEDEEM